MMDKKAETLKKRLQGDAICTWVIAGVVGMIGLSKVFTSINGFMNGGVMKGAYDGSPALLMGTGVRELLLAIAIALLALVLTAIKKDGRPFTKSNVRKFRTMAIIVGCAAIAKILVSSVTGFFDPLATFQLSVEMQDIIWVAGSAIIGIISEIFHYGYELQEDMDSIA